MHEQNRKDPPCMCDTMLGMLWLCRVIQRCRWQGQHIWLTLAACPAMRTHT